ncbi:MAG: NEL-type E3 ubiquitin ligase domain-containing protein [Candidatus Rhabdochlamydia sp.]
MHIPKIGVPPAHDLTHISNLQHTESCKVISAEKLYCLKDIEELPHQILIQGSVKIDSSNFHCLAFLRSKDVEIEGSFTCEDICLSKLLDNEQEVLHSWFHKLKVKESVHFKNLSAPFALANILEVGKDLSIESCASPIVLPHVLNVGENITLSNCMGLTSLSEELDVKRNLDISMCTNLTSFSKSLKVGGDLEAPELTHLISLPEGLWVGGYLDLSGCTGLTSLPKELQVRGDLKLSGCTGLTSLPEELQVRGDLSLSDCIGLTSLPERLQVEGDLILYGCTGLTSLPEGLTVSHYLNLSHCIGLTFLPKGLKIEFLVLPHCTGLTSLPEGLSVGKNLNLSGCTALTSLPEGLEVGGNLNLSDCTALTGLANNMRLKGNLDLTGCRSLTSLPNWVIMLGYNSSESPRTVDLTGTGLSPAVLSRLQEQARGMRGVQFYFSQETLEEYIVDFTELLPALEFWQECIEEDSFINIKELSKELHHRLTEIQDKKNLLSFLTRLTGTADYHNGATRPHLAERILQIMQRMSEDEEVCHHAAFLIHQGLSSCDDRVMTTLNDIMIDQMLRTLDHPSITAEELKTAGKGFFFMEQLDEKIKICINKLNFIDEVEVYMAFHTRLQKMLNLPIHMKNMLFRRCVAISDEDIDSIGRDVLQHATEAEFEVFLSTWSPWKRYQRRVSVIAWELLPTLDRKLTATDICPYLQDKPERPVIYNNVLYDYDAFIKRYIDEGIDVYRAQVQMDRLFRIQSS